MKWTLTLVLYIIAISNVLGQKNMENCVEATSPINIASTGVYKCFVPSPKEKSHLKSETVKSAQMIADYVDFPEEAKKAFDYAMSIWESQISSTVPIHVQAKWDELETNILALTRPAGHYKNFDASLIPNVYYPVALAEKLSGKEINSPEDPDISCRFNKNIPWYFGTDGNTPSTKYDFVTAVLHELAHGLGISGFLDDNNKIGFINNSGNIPSAYDYFIINIYNQRIVDKSIFNIPSSDLHQQMTSDKLKFACPDINQNGQSIPSKIFAPAVWREGASIYHLDENIFKSGDKNALMTPYTHKGEAIHNPGDVILDVLSTIGWKSVTFNVDKINDQEKTCTKLPIDININSDFDLDSSSVKMIFSTDYFATKDSIILTFNASTNYFSGKLPVNERLGKFQYFVKANTKENQTYKLPADAPTKKYSFRIGPDYYPPVVEHNPLKVIPSLVKVIDFDAVITDNIGVESASLEYKINGVSQNPIELKVGENNLYKGALPIPANLSATSSFEYRIVACDNSEKHNKGYLPRNGYYSVKIFAPEDPVKSYSNNFNKATADFTTSDFDISTPSGFTDGILSTKHPYPVSPLENKNCNLVAQLRKPIILNENGRMTFDEVVLVEPGEQAADFTQQFFWDYVVVEGSKDNGQTWQPIIEGYDSGIDDNWTAQFNQSLKNNMSMAEGNQSMFVKRTINLTENTGFAEGDTVLFRFRLASDKSVSGWGWAIDNLEIQKITTGDEIVQTDDIINVYPNPFANRIFVDLTNVPDPSTVEITVNDLSGKTILQKNLPNPQYNSTHEVDLPGIDPGIYLINMIVNNSQRITKKIIKN